jgi:hypothetical protein
MAEYAKLLGRSGATAVLLLLAIASLTIMNGNAFAPNDERRSSGRAFG